MVLFPCPRPQWSHPSLVSVGLVTVRSNVNMSTCDVICEPAVTRGGFEPHTVSVLANELFFVSSLFPWRRCWQPIRGALSPWCSSTEDLALQWRQLFIAAMHQYGNSELMGLVNWWNDFELMGSFVNAAPFFLARNYFPCDVFFNTSGCPRDFWK